MKQLIFPAAVALSVCLNAQPVVKTDLVAVLHTLPAPAETLAEAYKRTYTSPDAANIKQHYQPALAKLEALQQESQTLMMQFYQKHPMGMAETPRQAPNRVSAQDQAAMNSATAEMAQKLLTDPAFAQKFAQMSETEQQAYLAKMLADKGVKPAKGSPNVPNAMQPGLDRDWPGLCQAFSMAATDLSALERQQAIEAQYEAQHRTVDQWIETEIKKLPMISFGEYGHDHDPAKVAAIRRQGFDKHCEVANAMMKELSIMCAENRQNTRSQIAPLNDALSSVQYGAAYNFGLHYPLVLQTQSMMLGALYNLLQNEMNLQESVAKWEQERRFFAAQHK